MGTFSYCWPNFTIFLKIIFAFKAVSAHNSAQNFIKPDSDRTKEFTFRMSSSGSAYYQAAAPSLCLPPHDITLDTHKQNTFAPHIFI